MRKSFTQSLVAGVAVLLASCSSTPFMDEYIDTLGAQTAYSHFSHDEHGQLSSQMEPLKAQFDRCTADAFKGNEFLIGGDIISDPLILEQVYRDYHAYLLETVMMWGAKDEAALEALLRELYPDDTYAEVRRHAFAYTEGLDAPLRQISYLIKARNRCLLSQGWNYEKRAP